MFHYHFAYAHINHHIDLINDTYINNYDDNGYYTPNSDSVEDDYFVEDTRLMDHYEGKKIQQNKILQLTKLRDYRRDKPEMIEKIKQLKQRYNNSNSPRLVKMINDIYDFLTTENGRQREGLANDTVKSLSYFHHHLYKNSTKSHTMFVVLQIYSLFSRFYICTNGEIDCQTLATLSLLFNDYCKSVLANSIYEAITDMRFTKDLATILTQYTGRPDVVCEQNTPTVFSTPTLTFFPLQSKQKSSTPIHSNEQNKKPCSPPSRSCVIV